MGQVWQKEYKKSYLVFLVIYNKGLTASARDCSQAVFVSPFIVASSMSWCNTWRVQIKLQKWIMHLWTYELWTYLVCWAIYFQRIFSCLNTGIHLHIHSSTLFIHHIIHYTEITLFLYSVEVRKNWCNHFE